MDPYEEISITVHIPKKFKEMLDQEAENRNCNKFEEEIVTANTIVSEIMHQKEYEIYDSIFWPPDEFEGHHIKYNIHQYRPRAHINQVRRMNQQALQRARNDLNSIFDRMEQSVPVLVDDLYTLRTKGRIIYNAGLDYFPGERDNLNSLVLEKFEKHIISQDDLKIQINAVIQKLLNILSSNTSTMFSNIQIDLEVSNTPHMEIERLDKVTHEQILSSLKDQLVLSVGAEAATLTLEVIIAHLVIQSSARAGMATLTTIGSLGIGLIVAVITDMVISHYAKDHMTEKIQGMIRHMRVSVLEGSPQVPGISKQLEELVTSYSEAVEVRVLTAIDHSGR